MGREGSCCYHLDHIDKILENKPPGILFRLKHARRGGRAELDPSTFSMTNSKRGKNSAADSAQVEVYLPQEIL